MRTRVLSRPLHRRLGTAICGGAGEASWRKLYRAMKDRIKLPMSFDPKSLQNDLKRLEPGDWIRHFVKQNYDGDWSVIPLRGPATATHPVMMIYPDPACTEFSDTPFLRRLRYLPRVLRSFRCPLEAVRLMRLTAGSRINEHRDLDLEAESGNARLHIPIHTNDEVDFRLNGESVVLKEGECWYLRLSDPHSVVNRGPEDRIHVVIDAKIDKWLGTMLGI